MYDKLRQRGGMRFVTLRYMCGISVISNVWEIFLNASGGRRLSIIAEGKNWQLMR